MLVYAKSKPLETIEEHNRKLLENYEKLKNFLNPEKVKRYDGVIKKILYYHDLGKLNHKFQNKLGFSSKVVIPELKDSSEIPHEWLSLAFISREDKKNFHAFSTDGVRFAALVQYCIAFHHTRAKLFDRNALEMTIHYDLEKNKGRLGIDYILNFDYDILRDIKQKIDSQTNFKNYFELLVFFKGILHKCDYTASANIEPEKSYMGNYEADFNNWLSQQGWQLKPFQEAEQLFRNIAFNYCVIPRPIYEENEKEISELIEVIDNKYAEKMQRIQAKSKLKEFTAPVQIFGRPKCLTSVPDSEHCRKNNIMIMNDVIYSYEKGLQLTDRTEEGIFIQ